MVNEDGPSGPFFFLKIYDTIKTMSYSPIVSIMAASVALNATRYVSSSSVTASASMRRAPKPKPVKPLTPAEVAANEAAKVKRARKQQELKRKARFQEWMSQYREGNMTNPEFQHHLQYDKGFLEFVERTLKDRR